MGRFLCADSRVAIDDDAFEPGAFDCMLARHTFERVERVAEMIQRVPSHVVFGGQPLEFRFVVRLRPLELDPLVVVAVAQRLELAARRVEGLPERVTFRFDLPDRFLPRAEATFVIGSLLGEVRLPLRSALGCPPAESRSRREQTTARAREFGTCLAEIVFDVGAQFDLASEIVLDRLLTGAGGHPFGFRELLGVLQRELDFVKPGFERAASRRPVGDDGAEFRFAFHEPLCRRDRVCCTVLLGPLECRGSVAQLSLERLARRRCLRHRLVELPLEGMPLGCRGSELQRIALVSLAVRPRRLLHAPFERGPAVRLLRELPQKLCFAQRETLDGSPLERQLFLGFVERGPGGIQLRCQRVTLLGDLREVRSDRRVVRGATLRIGGAFRFAARLSLLDVSLKALELLLYGATRSRSGRERALEFCVALLEVLRRRNRVCCAVLLGALECHSRVAQLPFERLTRRRSLRHGLLERCPGVRRFQRSLFLRCLERGRRGTQLPCQRITLIGELGDACSDCRVVSGATFRIGGALRGMPRLGLLDVSSKALELLFHGATRSRGCRERALELRLVLLELLGRCSRVYHAVLLGPLERRSRVAQLPFEGGARRRSLRHRLLELTVEGMPLGRRGG